MYYTFAMCLKCVFVMVTKFFSIESYLQAPIEMRERAFYHYLIATGYAVSTSVNYPKFCATSETVIQLVKDIAGKDSLFDVVDDYAISRIFLKTGSKKAAVGRYREFILDISRRDGWHYSAPCESTKIMYACIESLTGNTFTKDDLLRFVPLFNTLYSKYHNAECVINEAIDTLLSEGKIILVSPGCYTPK